MLKNERSSYRQSVDLQVQVSVKGIRLPLNATIVDVSVTGCRLRSWIALERDANVAFDWPREGVQLRLAGTVAARRPSTEGEAFEYGVTFTGLLPAESDLLAREIVEAQRREAFNRAQRAAALNIKPSDVNRRGAYRANVRFSVELILADRLATPIEVIASDISAGGLRIAFEKDLRVNDEVTLRFRLPNDVLRIYPPQVEEVKKLRRPFEEMRIRSRIASRLEDEEGKPVFGIAFVEVDAYTREEIARFIHAVQLGELRERSERR
jgi:c-di-GMP-binding flagellar brake protein YcgR